GRADARDRVMAAQPGEAAHIVALQVRLAHGDPARGGGRTTQAHGVREMHGPNGRAAEVEERHAGDVTRRQRVGEQPEILSPVEIAVHEHAFRLTSGERVEVREKIWVRANSTDDLPDNQYCERRPGHAPARGLVPERNDDAAHGNGEQRVDEEDVAHTNVDLTQHGDDQDRRRGEERRDLTPVEPRGAIAREYPDGNGRQAEQRERRLHDQFDDRVVPPTAAVGVAEEVRRLTARVVLHELLEPGAKLRRGNRNVTAARPRYVKAVHAPDDDAGADEAEHSGDHVCAETRDAPAGCGRDLAGAVTSAGAIAEHQTPRHDEQDRETEE